MTNEQKKTLHLALRLIGDPHFTFEQKFWQIHGLYMLAVNFNGTSNDLLDVNDTVRHLYLEEDLRVI